MGISLVSCIIPCFNSVKYIREAINSIINQTYGNVEIITIDDASTDETVNILSEYSSKINIKILVHEDKKNHGKSASTNLGLSISNGEFVAFLDHDDIWHPKKIEKQVAFLEQNKEIGLVYTNGIYMNDLEQETGPILPVSFEEKNDPSSLLMNCYIKSASQVMMRKTVIDNIGLFNETLIGCDDHDMWLRTIEQYKIAYLNEVLFKYRIHDKQLSNNVEIWNNGFHLLEQAKNRYAYKHIVLKRRKAVLNYRLAMFGLRNRKYFHSVFHLFLAGILDPMRSLRVVLGSERNKL
jgi:glycosyltransferase involved in cell wall biosynthesis